MAPDHNYYRFRWVDCQLGYLRNCLPGRIRHALEELPETLDGTYERALKDLEKANWEFAHRLLQFVAVASRPLRVEELAQFLGLDFTTEPVPKFEQDWLLEDPVDAVLSTTSSLLAIVDLGGSQVIQFSHFSVKEFLTSSRLAEAKDIFVQRYHISMTGAHTLAARSCLGMLLHLVKNITTDGLDKFPLAEYAAAHWVDHARFEDVSLKVEDGMKRLFDPNNFHFGVWVWIHDLEDRYWRREKRGKCPSAPRGTPLHYASLCGLDAIVKFLVIDHLQDVDSRGFDDESTALHLASRKGYIDVVRFLLGSGTDAGSRNKRKSTPLHEASIGGHAEVVRALMEHGVDITAEDDDEMNPVALAFIGGHVEVTRVFLEFGVDVTGEDINEWPPLHRALFEGRTEAACALIERGADITHEFEDEMTPLNAASIGGHAASILVLLEHGLDLTANDDDVGDSLHIACFGGHAEVARLLLECGAHVETRRDEGWTPLHCAAAGGHVEVLRLLLEHGADMEAQGENGMTPLHTAAINGSVAAARLLLERGANVTTRKVDGKTPLHSAVANGHVEITRLLLDSGADTTAQSNDGQTPIRIAEAKENAELSRLLLERGTDATAKADDGQAPLHITIDKGCLGPPHIHHDRGTHGTAQSDEGSAPLQVAAAERNTNTICERQADKPTQADNDSVRTSIQVVAAKGLAEPLGLLPSQEIDAIDRADNERTSAQIAMSDGYVEPASLRPDPRAVMTAQASNELNPSNVTDTQGHVEPTCSLCQPGLDATVHVDDGQSLLRMAPQRGHKDVVGVPLGHGTAIVHDDHQQWCRCMVQ